MGGLEAKKCHFSKILIPEKCDFLSFQGPSGLPPNFLKTSNFQYFLMCRKKVGFLGGHRDPPVIFLDKNGSKSSVLPWIEKSWPFGPQKIALKESYGGFPLGGALKAPPPNRVKFRNE